MKIPHILYCSFVDYQVSKFEKFGKTSKHTFRYSNYAVGHAYTTGKNIDSLVIFPKIF